jgi:hypothetical protein
MNWCSLHSKRKAAERDGEEGLLPWEADYFNLSPFPALGLFDDYLEMIIQFGFITVRKRGSEEERGSQLYFCFG